MRRAIIQNGKILLALFLPQYIEDPVSHALRGRDAGAVGEEMARSLAAPLGVDVQIVGYPTPAATVEGLKAGHSHLGFMGIEPSRTLELDFSPAVVEFDYTFLVPTGSAVENAADVDRPGIRVAVVRTHASTLALSRIVKHAEVTGFELPEATFDAFRAGQADAMAFPRFMLIEYSERLPGSRVLPDAYGVNQVGIAIPKGHPEWLGYVTEFVEGAKTSGLIQRIIENAGLRGFRVAKGRAHR